MARILSKLAAVSVVALLAGCARPAPRVATKPAPRPVVTSAAPEPEPEVTVVETAAGPPPEHWYFEHLAANGRNALLRRLDATGRMTLQMRIVDVDTGAVLEEVQMPDLGKFPGATVGVSAAELAKLDAVLASPRFVDDLTRGAHVAQRFPFGSCGRLSAGTGNVGIAFNAGDWLYLADNAGHVKKKLSQEAAYDPRYSPDGKVLFFRRATGAIDRVFAKYELFAMPTDLSQPAKVLPGTAGVREGFDIGDGGQTAVVIASHEPVVKTCVLSVGLRAPFAVKKLGCLEGGERLVEYVVSPKGRWAAFTTQTPPQKDARPVEKDAKAKQAPAPLAWRLRVLSLASGQLAYDVPAEAGYSLRAISDDGTLVQSGLRGIVVDDVPKKARKEARVSVDLGYRAFFRSGEELVVQRGSTVGVVDVSALTPP